MSLVLFEPIQLSQLDTNYFDLKTPKNKYVDKFNARLLSNNEKQALVPIFEEWNRTALEKQRLYTNYKEHKRNKNNYVNPFMSIRSNITAMEELINQENNHFFGVYDKSNQLQALAVAGFYQNFNSNDVLLKYIIGNPNNIRTRCNKKRVDGAARCAIDKIANFEYKTGCKNDKILVIASQGARTYYPHIGFMPSHPPRRGTWELLISSKAKEEYVKDHQEYLANPNLDTSDLTEETSEEQKTN